MLAVADPVRWTDRAKSAREKVARLTQQSKKYLVAIKLLIKTTQNMISQIEV